MLIVGAVVGLLAGIIAGQAAWIVWALTGALVGWLYDQVTRLSTQVKALQLEMAQRGLAEQTPGRAEVPSAPVPAPESPAPLASVAPVAPPPERLDAERAADAGFAAVPQPNVVVKWLLGGNTVVRIGVVILFFGVAFLLKFAYEHSHVPLEVRLIGVSLGAMALLAVGWRLRERTPGYALTLQGGGIGLLYLTIFAAFRLYSVLPAGPAFVLLVMVAACSALLAVLQDSLALAVAGASGGFLAPILASTGHGSHVMLFSYYVVLNLGIVAVAWKRAWRVLNLIGFGFTFVIGLLWGAKYYEPEYFASTEPFLGIFFLLYVLIPLLFARHQAERPAPYVDASLVFGVPLVAFGLQAGLVREFAYGSAWSALALGAFYLLAASLLWNRIGAPRRLLTEAFLALGSGFATLAIPLAFDGRTTSAVWAIEGAAVVWVGFRQGRYLARVAGYGLQLAAGAAFLLSFNKPAGDLPILNSAYLGCALIALSSWFCSAYVTREIDKVRPFEKAIPAILMIWGALWWVGGGLGEIDRHLAVAFVPNATLVFLSATAAGLSLLSRSLPWPVARWAAYAVTPVMALTLLLDFVKSLHPLGNLGYAAWPVAFAVHLWILRRHEGQDSRLQQVLHAAWVWIVAILLSWEANWQIDQAVHGEPVWAFVALGLVPTMVLWLLDTRSIRQRWPLTTHARTYLTAGTVPIAIYLLGWTVWANVASDGEPAPLPYIVLLNPLDISIGLVFLALAHWFLRRRRDGYHGPMLANRVAVYALAGAAAFICANGVVLRALHHWASVPFGFDAMWRSVLVQAAFSLLWSLTALLLMTYATRRQLRELWLVGAALMGVDVIKLLAIDLSNIGGVERIVSFIGVGALMLVIGYLAPVPPRRRVVSREGSR